MPAVQLTVPTIGTKLTLTRRWSFPLHRERRNASFAKRLLLPGEWNNYINNGDPFQVVIPKGTVLTVRRIYIRQGGGDYDSITFTIPKGCCPDKKIHGRFWAKLADVNLIKCEWDMDTVKKSEQDAVTALGDVAGA